MERCPTQMKEGQAGEGVSAEAMFEFNLEGTLMLSSTLVKGTSGKEQHMRRYSVREIGSIVIKELDALRALVGTLSVTCGD